MIVRILRRKMEMKTARKRETEKQIIENFSRILKEFKEEFFDYSKNILNEEFYNGIINKINEMLTTIISGDFKAPIFKQNILSIINILKEVINHSSKLYGVLNGWVKEHSYELDQVFSEVCYVDEIPDNIREEIKKLITNLIHKFSNDFKNISPYLLDDKTIDNFEKSFISIITLIKNKKPNCSLLEEEIDVLKNFFIKLYENIKEIFTPLKKFESIFNQELNFINKEY